MGGRTRFLFVVAIWASAMLQAGRSGAHEEEGQADAMAEAKKHFESGLALFKAEKYDAAALELEESVRLFSTKGGVFNLASVYKVQSRYDEALEALDRLEMEHGARMDEEMRSAAAKMRLEIEKLVARIDVRVEPEDAVVLVDGLEIPKARLVRPLAVDPGSHVVRAELPGRKPVEVRVRLLSGQTERVQLLLDGRDDTGPTAPQRVSGAGEEIARPAPPNEDALARKKLGIAPFAAVAAVAVAAGAATIALGVKAGDKEDEGLEAGDQDIVDEAKPLQTAGRVTLGLTLGAGIAAAVLAFFTEFRSGKETLAIGIAPNGAAVAGRF